MYRNVLRKLGASLVSMAEEKPRHPSPSKRRHYVDANAHRLLKERRTQAAPLTAGTIQLVGLGEIMSSLGGRSAVAEQARALAESAIEAHISPNDSYQLQGDETYVICFAHLSEAHAAKVASRISRQIRELLDEELPEQSESIEVDHFVASVDSASLDSSSPLAEQLAASLGEIRREAQQAVKARRAALIRAAQVLYRPMWYAKKEMVSLYRCMLDGESGNSAVEHLKVLSSAEELQAALAELDCLVFARSMKTLHALLQKQASAVFVIPVNFHTLADKARRDEYLLLCESIPESYRKFISFELYGLPGDTPTSRIEQVLSTLQPFCKALAIEVPLSYPRLGELGNPNLWGISFSLEKRNDAGLLKFAVRLVHSQNLRAIAHGVNTYGQLSAALDAGFDYVDGSAVLGSAESPRGTFRYRPSPIDTPKTAAIAG